MIRTLARELGREGQIEGVRVPRHEPGPPETLTDTTMPTCCASPTAARSSANATTPDSGVLGDCGRRFAELRGLRARDLRRPRSNERHHRLFVRGKGGGEREVPVALAVQQALEVWLKVHPLAHGVGRRGATGVLGDPLPRGGRAGAHRLG
jgi:site-specific recombinase XerC